MTHQPTTTPEAPEVPSVAAQAAELAAAVECLQAVDRLTAKALRLLGRALHNGICETVEGLPLDIYLTNVCRLIGSDRSTLLTAADVLRHMPILASLFERGQVSWGQVRNICRRASRRPVTQRSLVDDRIGRTVERWGGLEGFHPDELLHETDLAFDELENTPTIERREDRAANSNFLAVQPRFFDGGIRFLGEADAVNGATLLDAWEAAACDHDNSSGGETDELGVEPDDGRPNRKDRARRRFDGLLACAQTYLAGGNGRKPRPSLNVIVDTRDVHINAAGQLETRLPGCLPTLSARLVELLADDADVRAVIFDGARPLAVSAKQRADDIPEDVRLAVRLRDRGDRFPGSNLPSWRDHQHAFTLLPNFPRTVRGNTCSPACAGSCQGAHHTCQGTPDHKRGWKPTLDPHTGLVTWTRHHRNFRTLPRGTPLEPAPNSGGSDPPGDPPDTS